MRAWITRSPIDVTAVLALVGTPADGASVLFLGHVRAENGGVPVAGMRYDAYLEMAEQILHDIALEAVDRLGTERLAVVHRIGELAVGEVSVAIAASSPHRATAFDACRHVIEQIKERLPVWKQEHYLAGAPRWLAGDAVRRRDAS